MKQIEAWQCSFCDHYRKTKSAITKHEERCFYNPDTHSCATCYHLAVFPLKCCRIHAVDFGELTTHCLSWEENDE